MADQNSATTTRPRWRPPTKAIITDAGFASRFLPWTKTNPKAMLPMINKPIMQLVVQECVDAGINDIIIVTTPEGASIYWDYFNNAIIPVRKQLDSQGKLDRYESIEEVLGFPKIRIQVQDPTLPYGNGSPILSAKQFIAEDEAFVVCYSDDIVLGSSDVKTMIDKFKAHPDSDGVIMAQQISPDKVDNYGMIALKGEERLLDHIMEKPAQGSEPSLLASYGRYLLTPSVFQYLNPANTGKDNELWTVDAITELAKWGKIYVEPTKGQWRTTGDPANYLLAQLELAMETDYADDIRQFIAEYPSD